MNVLIVYGHPKPDSFNHAILENFTRGLKDSGHTFEVIDLYAIKFNPVFDVEDYNYFAHETVPEDMLEEMDLRGMILSVVGRGPLGFIKKAMAKRWMAKKSLSEIVKEISKHKPKDVLEQQEKVANADALVYIFPVIWNNFPAIFLGWLQRVIQYGFAYVMNEEGWRGDVDGRISLLKHKKALIINTTFFKEKDMKERGFHDAMEKIMDDWSLRYPGIKNVEHVYFYSVISVGEEIRKGYLQRAYQMGKEF
jgi:NAD(P)H dehydrogenase (quinone)